MIQRIWEKIFKEIIAQTLKFDEKIKLRNPKNTENTKENKKKRSSCLGTV